MSSGWRSTTSVPGASRRAGTRPGFLDVPRAEMLAALRAAGVALSPTFGPTHVRAVTHLDLEDADIDRAIELVAETLHSHAIA